MGDSTIYTDVVDDEDDSRASPTMRRKSASGMKPLRPASASRKSFSRPPNDTGFRPRCRALTLTILNLT